jgi:hypothetical protein
MLPFQKACPFKYFGEDIDYFEGIEVSFDVFENPRKSTGAISFFCVYLRSQDCDLTEVSD